MIESESEEEEMGDPNWAPTPRFKTRAFFSWLQRDQLLWTGVCSTNIGSLYAATIDEAPEVGVLRLRVEHKQRASTRVVHYAEHLTLEGAQVDAQSALLRAIAIRE